MSDDPIVTGAGDRASPGSDEARHVRDDVHSCDERHAARPERR
jgi:hypothetical protein